MEFHNSVSSYSWNSKETGDSNQYATIMLCLFLLFRKLKRMLLSTYPSVRRLAKAPSCQVLVRLLCGFCQIAAIVLCILLKFRFLDVIHVAYVVFGVAIVGGENNI